MTKLEFLYAQQSEKFGQLCAVAARELGYGELSALSVEDRIRVEDEAKQYVEQWEETVEMKTDFTIRRITPLRRLLAEYHDICERILDEHELDAGLWAYRKEPRDDGAQRPFKTPAPTKQQSGQSDSGGPRFRSVRREGGQLGDNERNGPIAGRPYGRRICELVKRRTEKNHSG